MSRGIKCLSLLTAFLIVAAGSTDAAKAKKKKKKPAGDPSTSLATSLVSKKSFQTASIRDLTDQEAASAKAASEAYLDAKAEWDAQGRLVVIKKLVGDAEKQTGAERDRLLARAKERAEELSDWYEHTAAANQADAFLDGKPLEVGKLGPPPEMPKAMRQELEAVAQFYHDQWVTSQDAWMRYQAKWKAEQAARRQGPAAMRRLQMHFLKSNLNLPQTDSDYVYVRSHVADGKLVPGEFLEK